VEELGDRYTATTLRTNVLPVTWLIIDDPDQAERDSADAIRRWSKSPQWHIQHWCDFFGQGRIDRARSLWLVRPETSSGMAVLSLDAEGQHEARAQRL
jgi:hypothetical protein